MIEDLGSALLDLVAPFSCILCARRPARPAAPLCPSCIGRLAWWRSVDGCPRCGFESSEQVAGRTSAYLSLDRMGDDCPGEGLPACPRCYSSGSPLHRCHSLLRYEGRARDWIPRFKHRTTPFGPSLETRVAIDYLSSELAHRLAARRASRPDLILPIPLHPRRRRKRGFNHSDLIARRIAKTLDLPTTNRVLIRSRDTAPQASLCDEQRRENVRRAFRCARPLTSSPCVWLVDDVLTTGATLEAAAEACLDAGADEVHAVTIAATTPLERRGALRPEGAGSRHGSPASTSVLE